MANRGLAMLVSALIGCAALPTAAQDGTDPNAALTNEVIVAQLPGRSIPALVTHRPGAARFTHAIALFPGSPGYMNLRMEDGRIRFDLAGNFLVRARRHFLENGYLTVVIDAPSDQAPNFWPAFRETPRYGEDIKSVIETVSKKYGPLDWTFIGTSEGSISAVHAARMLPTEARRIVLTSSVVTHNKRGRGMSASDVAKVGVPVLWVHHRDDPCQATPYATVQRYAAATQAPLVTVTGASGQRGPACMAFSEHGFVGMEVKTIKAIVSWIRTGQVPPDVSE